MLHQLLFFMLFSQRLAELEQSEATLKCQVIMLEDQLIATKTSLATTNEENGDLKEECQKLSSNLSKLN